MIPRPVPPFSTSTSAFSYANFMSLRLTGALGFIFFRFIRPMIPIQIA